MKANERGEPLELLILHLQTQSLDTVSFIIVWLQAKISASQVSFVLHAPYRPLTGASAFSKCVLWSGRGSALK